MKHCFNCKQTKSKSEFSVDQNAKDKLQSRCRVCNKLMMKNWHKNNPSDSLLRNYGITLEQKKQMIATQNNCCAICKEPFKNTKSTHVDHCHDSSKVRGILCTHCNTSLGGFRDSPKLLQRAIHYVEHHAKKNTTAPVSEGDYIYGAVGAEIGSISTPWTWEDYDHSDDHSGAVSRQDADHSTQASSGDGVGHRSQKVGALEPLTRIEDHGQPEPEIVRLEFGRRYLSDKP